MSKADLRWAVGVTTCPVRRSTLLPKTLDSICKAGFPRPRLFVDGDNDAGSWQREFDLEATCRFPALRIHGNWVLTLYELFIRDPSAERYAVFQDDLLCCRNLRAYLERVPYPDGVYACKGSPGYLNLYTAPSNQSIAPTDQTVRHEAITGFYRSNQLGKGAVALVFSQAAVLVLLSSRHLLERPIDQDRGWRAVDGGIVDSFRKAGWSEYVHNPSLVLHTGRERSFHSQNGEMAGTNGQRPAVWDKKYEETSFPGEGFDALGLLAVAK